MNYLTEIGMKCGCHEFQVGLLRGKRSFKNITCARCNQPMETTKSHYIMVPLEMRKNKILLTAWMKDDLNKHLLGLTGLARLQRSKLTLPTKDLQEEVAAANKIPICKETFRIGKYHVFFYGEVMRFKKIPVPTKGELALAYRGSQIMIKSHDVLTIISSPGFKDYPEDIKKAKAIQYLKEFKS